MARRFFVTIVAANRPAFNRLGDYDLDIFVPTAKADEETGFSIEGLLDLEQVERLVLDGYRVLVEEESSRRARALTETIDFEQWVREMGG